jgi:hypothetical protein
MPLPKTYEHKHLTRKEHLKNLKKQVKVTFSKKDVIKSLKMSNLGKRPTGTNGITGQVGKKVKAINNKVDDIDDVFNPKV